MLFISVDTCLKMCGMEDYADAIVGTLAVEQRKRTTIGVELAAKVHPILQSNLFTVAYRHAFRLV